MSGPSEPIVLHMRGRFTSWWIVTVWWRSTGKRPLRRPSAAAYMRAHPVFREDLRARILEAQRRIDGQ